MRQFGLDTVYASLTLETEQFPSELDFALDEAALTDISIFGVINNGYGHDLALSAYVGEAFDIMLENVTDRGSIDIETNNTLFCCACGACSDQQEAGPVMIDGFVTLASLMDAGIGFGESDSVLSAVLEDVYGMDSSEASQYLFNPVTGEFVLVQGFDGHLTKGATLSFDANGDGIGVRRRSLIANSNRILFSRSGLKTNTDGPLTCYQT